MKASETITKTLLGDPEGMRKVDNWIGDAGQIGEYNLSNGRVARVLWLRLTKPTPRDRLAGGRCGVPRRR